jgi:hypothetical protein
MNLHALVRLKENEDWKEAKQVLEEDLAILESITSLPDDLSPEALGLEVRSRQGAISIMQNLIARIEGSPDELKFNAPAEKAAPLITNHEEET